MAASRIRIFCAWCGEAFTPAGAALATQNEITSDWLLEQVREILEAGLLPGQRGDHHHGKDRQLPLSLCAEPLRGRVRFLRHRPVNFPATQAKVLDHLAGALLARAGTALGRPRIEARAARTGYRRPARPPPRSWVSSASGIRSFLVAPTHPPLRPSPRLA